MRYYLQESVGQTGSAQDEHVARRQQSTVKTNSRVKRNANGVGGGVTIRAAEALRSDGGGGGGGWYTPSNHRAVVQ